MGTDMHTSAAILRLEALREDEELHLRLDKMKSHTCV
jgi:hypothetical protein